MMNAIALAFLVSYFGAAVVLVPEPHLTHADLQSSDSRTPADVFRAAKESVQNAVCDEEPCPSSMDQVKGTLHQGVEKTAEGVESAKESVKEAYEQAKHGVQDKAEHAKEAIQDKAGQLKHGAYETTQQAKEGIQEKAGQVKDKAGQVKHGASETAQQAKEGIQDKAGQIKEGVQETVGKATSHIPSVEQAKQATRETGEKAASYIPSKDGVVETGKEAADTVKQKVGETKDKVASYFEGSDTPSSYGRDSVESLRKKLEDARRQLASYMQGKENDVGYLSFLNMRQTLDEASSYLPSKESAAQYIPGRDSIASLTKGAQEASQGMQERARDASESARRAAKEAAQGVQDKAHDVGEWGQEGEGGEGYMGKLGGALHGVRERFSGRPQRKGMGRGRGQLEKKVQELCSLFDGGVVGRMVTLDVAATRESYGYLMENALGSIEKARELFQKAADELIGGEWREQYVYLADSAKGALEAAKDVFERAASAAEGREPVHAKVSSFGKTENVSKLKQAAIETKERLSATLRPIMRSIYLATFSAVYGVTLWMTFLSGHLLARSLPRQQLGIVQSKLFPVYLRLLSGCLALCAVIHGVLHPFPSADRQEHLQYMNFGVCIGLSLLNLLVVEPKATKMMFEKLKYEKEEGRGQSEGEVNDEAAAKARDEAAAKARDEAATKARTASIDSQFKGLHQAASCLNLAIVAGLTWHLLYLANRLVV